MKAWKFCALFSAMLLGACVSMGGPDVRIRALAARPPANVAVYLSVGAEDRRLDELTASDFVLFEDEHQLSPEMTRQTLLDKSAVVAHHTVVLVDNSGATQPEVREELSSAISIFAEEVSDTQPISVYAYDGGERLTQVVEIPRGAGKGVKVPRLAPRDLSRNLNGAILEGGELLDRRLAAAGKPFGVGTLVVFAAGADLAGRTDGALVQKWLDETQTRVLAIGYGEQSDTVRSYAKDGYYDAVAQSTVSLAFEDAGHDVAEEFYHGFLLSYCSPARSGTRALRIDVRAPGGGDELLGEASSEFSAEGFRAGCEPTLLPRFVRASSNQAEPAQSP